MTAYTECCPAYTANSDYPSAAFASLAAQIEQKIQQILDAMTPERIAGATLSQMAAALKTLATQAQAFHKIAAAMTAAVAPPLRHPKEHQEPAERAVPQLPTSSTSDTRDPERAESSDATPDAPGAARAATQERGPEGLSSHSPKRSSPGWAVMPASPDVRPTDAVRCGT